MSTTSTPPVTQYIDTNILPSTKTSYGEVKPILNEAIAGAKNVVVELRWLEPGQTFKPEVLDKHQLLYLMEGSGRIVLEGKNYDVSKGAGVYLGPKETATISATGAKVKLFHITVPNKLP